MGVDSHLYLPPTTEIRDFVNVLAALLGAESRPEPLSDDGSFHAVVEHSLRMESAPRIPEMLTLTGNVGDESLMGFWHWEPDGSPAHIMPGCRLFSVRMADSRRPVLEALADFFGGMLDFNDCDSIEVDYIGDLRNKNYRPDANDGLGWEARQQAVLDVVPISTPKEWNR